MDKLLRFSDYDIFAYLTSGFATFVIWDLISNSHLVLGATWTVSDGVLIIMAAYVVGQIIASPAAFVFERGLVRGALGKPADVLTQPKPSKGLRGFLGDTIL